MPRGSPEASRAARTPARQFVPVGRAQIGLHERYRQGSFLRFEDGEPVGRSAVTTYVPASRKLSARGRRVSHAIFLFVVSVSVHS